MFNVNLAQSQQLVDKVNGEFYGQFNYPWPPIFFQSFVDSGMQTMLNHDLGYFSSARVPEHAKIWVAGCGTNQALITALKFPQATVVGTDISKQSLEICQKNIDNLGVTNLKLYERSINEVDYKEEFDYIICTGVIHHNANPEFTLMKLSDALSKDGVLELMVYNYYHRITTTACQKAIKNLCGSATDFNLQLDLTKRLIDTYPAKNLMSDFLSAYKHSQGAELADAFIQPVEYSYTVESLNKLLNTCGLEYLLPCANQFDKERKTHYWNMEFGDTELKRRYQQLPDHSRWNITNLIMLNESPMLWFYIQKKDSTYNRRSEKEIVEEFFQTKFEKFMSLTQEYILDKSGTYQLDPTQKFFPPADSSSDELSAYILNNLDSNLTMRDVFRKLGVEESFQNINRVRINLTTVQFPYLSAVES